MAQLTRDGVIGIVGRLDDRRIAEIIDTGATEAEVTEAWAWLAADDALARTLHRQPAGRVAQLVEILSADEVDLEEPPRG